MMLPDQLSSTLNQQYSTQFYVILKSLSEYSSEANIQIAFFIRNLNVSALMVK